MIDCIRVKPESNVEVMLQCDLVASTTQRVDEKLMELVYGQKPAYFIINMVNVEMVDSSGIGLLLALHSYLKETQCPMTIINISDDIHDLLIRMRIDKRLTIKK